MIRRFAAAFSALTLAACAAHVAPPAPVARAPIEVQILAFNDFHGNLETPPPVEVADGWPKLSDTAVAEAKRSSSVGARIARE